jgi:tetratricopeptide (TPR) repeat protein
MTQIIQTDHTANPLYLRVLVEELQIFGSHAQLGERITHYLSSSTVPALYEKILARYEADYERDSPGLVGATMTALWASRRGLTEAELLELLGSAGAPLPAAYWSPLYLAAEASLVNRSGLLSFAHDYLRQAVQQRYLPREEEQEEAHTRLADFFATQERSLRQIEELPWQLAMSKAWQRLYTLLADLAFLAAAWQANPFEVKTYWTQLEEHIPLRTVEAYRPVLDAPVQHHHHAVWHVATLLSDTGHLPEAFALRDSLVEHARQRSDFATLSAALGNQALILKTWDRLEEALALHQEQERLCRELGNKDGLQATLGNQALILKTWGRLEEALALHQEQERLCRELRTPDGLARSLANQALLLATKLSRPHEALPLAEEAYQLATEHNLTVLVQQIEPMLDSVKSKIAQIPVPVYISPPHSAADPDHAFQLNSQYQQELARWKTLPWWKRLMVKKPQPPKGI